MSTCTKDTSNSEIFTDFMYGATYLNAGRKSGRTKTCQKEGPSRGVQARIHLSGFGEEEKEYREEDEYDEVPVADQSPRTERYPAFLFRHLFLFGHLGNVWFRVTHVPPR